MPAQVQTIPRAFGDVAVHFIERDGALWLTSDELARCLGYADGRGVLKVADRHRDEIAGLRSVVKLATTGGAKEVAIFEERAAYLLACLAKTDRGAAFRAWVVETCHDLRTREKVLVDREVWDRHGEVIAALLEANARMASVAGHMLAMHRHSKPKTDPRQLLLDGFVVEEIEDGAPAGDA